MKYRDVFIPYVRISQLIRFMKSISGKEASISNLSTNSGMGKSQIFNIIPTVKGLGLAKYHKNIVEMTEPGLKFRNAIISKDEDLAKGIIKSGLANIKALDFVVKLLDRKESITIEEIGSELAQHFGQTWNNPLTFRTYGAACASIVAFAGYGKYGAGLLRKSDILPKPVTLPAPEVTVPKIRKLLNIIYKAGEIDLNKLAQRVNGQTKRLGAELPVLVELDVVGRSAHGSYKITDKGMRIIDPSIGDGWQEAFRDCLLSSGYISIIKKWKSVV